MLKHISWFCLLILVGCGGQPTDLKPKEYRGRFEDKKDGISFVCPGRWEVREFVHGSRVICRSAPENAQDTFQENLVVGGPIPGKTVEEARQQAAADLKAQLTDYQEQVTSPQAIDFTHTQNGQKLRAHAQFLAHPGGGFWMATLTSTDADYKRWEWDFNNILNSLGKPLPTPTPAPKAKTPSPTPAPK